MRRRPPRPRALLPVIALLGALSSPAGTRADPVPAEASGERGGAPAAADDARAPRAEEAARDDDLEAAGTADGAAAATEPSRPTSSGGDGDARGHGRSARPFTWSDGPRRVPTPRGRSAERAAELGLGTRECASRLLHGAPDATWCAAARGREPERLLWPVDDGGWVRGFGYVRTTRPDLIHRGVDIAAPEGTIVRAAADGIVAYADNGVHGYGNLVMIVHRNGWMTLYAHNSRVTVQAGYRVRRGERIALVGATGIAHGPHVHFELWQAGRAVDPAPYFDGGPTFVERIAERAAARGEVPPPAEVTPDDRREEPPLPPHPDDTLAAGATGARAPAGADTPRSGEAPPSASGAGAAGEPAPDGGEAPSSSSRAGAAGEPAPHGARAAGDARAGGDALAPGSVALARHLRAHPAPEVLLATVEGRVFSTLLFPVRGGAITRAHSSSRRPMEITGDAGAAVRAAADGLVVFAGALPGHGDTVVLLHPNGWVTFYARVTLVSEVAVGTRVERGAWIARAGPRAMRFELRVGGVVRDPADLLVDPRERARE